MGLQVVFVHGIRTSATMWRAHQEHLRERGIDSVAVDLPGHGTRREEVFTLAEAATTVDRAVRAAADRGPVLLVGHSMGGLLCLGYAGGDPALGLGDALPPIVGLVAVSCTSLPRGIALSGYRLAIRAATALPRNGEWFTEPVLERTLPPETRADFGAGGWAYAAQDAALGAMSGMDLMTAVPRISVPLWFVNGQYDQLRLHERLFRELAPDAELIVVPRATHLVTAMFPRVFNAVLDLAVATIEYGDTPPGPTPAAVEDAGN